MGKHVSTLLDDPVMGEADGDNLTVVLLLFTISIYSEGRHRMSTYPPCRVPLLALELPWSVKSGVETASSDGSLSISPVNGSLASCIQVRDIRKVLRIPWGGKHHIGK